MRELQEGDIVFLEVGSYKQCCMSKLELRDSNGNPVNWPGRNNDFINFRVGMPQDSKGLLELIASLLGFSLEEKEMQETDKKVFILHKIVPR